MEVERVKQPTLVRQEQRSAAPSVGSNENRLVQLQSLIGNHAVSSLIGQRLNVQRTPQSDDREPVSVGTITGLWNVPANLKGRLLKIHLVARYGELSEADATKLVDLHNMPSDDSIDRQSTGAVKFFLSAREEALITKARLSRGVKDAKSGRKQTIPELRDERSLEQAVTTAADVGTDFAPIVGNLKDAYIAMTGENPVTGEKVGIAGRILAGIFALPIMGNVLKYLGKGSKLIADVGKWIAKTQLGKWIIQKSMRRWKKLPQNKGELEAGSKAKGEAARAGREVQLKAARGHEMLGESLQHLKNSPPSRRIEMFDDFARQIEEATKGSWSASKSMLQDGTAVFAGTAGHTLVITAQGKVYKGMIQNPEHFIFDRNRVPVPNFPNLKELM